MARNWYIVQTYTSQEKKAHDYMKTRLDQDGFRDNIFDVLVPEENVKEMKNGKKRSFTRKVFPGYIFVEMDFNEANYRLITSVPGVLGFVEYNGVVPPRPLLKSEITKLIRNEREEEKEETPVPTNLFRIDEQVKVIDGAFKDFVGVVEEVNEEKGRLKVRVEIFGRSTPVDVDFLQVEKV